jgi:hypothetical protein
VLTQGTNGAASYLASWHATQGFSDQSETVKVNVDAINNLTDYIRVRDYLKGFDTVSDVTPVVVAPPQLKLRISMRGSARNLQRLIMLGDTLLPAEAPVPEGAVLPEGGTDAVPVTQAQNELFYRLGQ